MEAADAKQGELTFADVCWSIGSPQLATDLRRCGALVETRRHGRVLLYDVDYLKEVIRRYVAGEFDEALAKLAGRNRQRDPEKDE